MYTTASNFNRAINLGRKEIGKRLKIDDLEFYASSPFLGNLHCIE